MWWVLPVAAVVALGGMSLGLIAWLVRSRARERRKARYLAQLSPQYRRARPGFPESGVQKLEPESPKPRAMITVAELVTRLEAEGLAVRRSREERL